MRHAHPNLYLVFLMVGIVAFGNGLAVALTDPRMPLWMPAQFVGSVFMVAGAVAVAAVSVSMKVNPNAVLVGKVALAVVAMQSMAMAVGLTEHFGSPDAVTASLDRPIMYLAFAAMCVVCIREPPTNPATATE